MIAEGYGDRRTLERRVQGMWKMAGGSALLEADGRIRGKVIDIDLTLSSQSCVHRTIRTTRVCCLTYRGRRSATIGSCMTTSALHAAGSFWMRTAQLPTRLWWLRQPVWMQHS